VLESFLPFTIVIEPEFVHGCVVDCPAMSEVVLLKALIDDGTESRHICTRGLKYCKRRNLMVIIEVVVKAEVLLVIEAVVQL